MTLGACLREAITALRLNALRSGLTAIGVIIGVAGIIVLSAAGGGANRKIEQQINALGSDTLIIAPVKMENTGQRGPVVLLTDDDAKAIAERVPEIVHITREVDGNVTIVAGNASWTPEYWGVDASYADVFNVKTSEGRFLDERDVRSAAKVIVLGATVAEKLFGGAQPVDQIVRMGGVPMRVIGVRSTLGFVGGQNQDNHVFVPITTARSRLPQKEKIAPRQLNLIDMKVLAGADRAAVKEAILALLRERKHIRDGEQDRFDVFDPTQFVELMNATHGTLSLLLGATAAISLLVGGVGIMNIMLVSVTERTSEIGLRMAVGARKRDILAQFLTEAVALCLAAGIAGLALGAAGAYATAAAAGWPFIVGPQSVALALAASVGVGVAFGYVPARRAASLNPIDALRHE
ncbi:ABC transporter permease [Methylocapsa aurea]|uniref:ABC transporter permease n=1 Tax=Methylocapsa aurea TaxID=663610 RepID=UPI00056BBEEB|nr:ABC transporter permease [Methylocapsa aurea]